MAWILTLLCITVMSTTAYRPGQFGFPSYYPGYSNDYEYPKYSLPVRRVDYENHHRAQLRTNEPYTDDTNVRPTQRMNERSIAVTSNIQQVQDQERTRLQTKTEGGRRVENGTYKIVNDYPKSQPSFDSRKGLSEDTKDSVVFPGLTSRSSIPSQLEISEECKKLGYCENVPNYPEEEVASLLNSLSDEIKESFTMDKLETPEIAQRIGPIEENEICDAIPQIVYPKSLPDEKGDWHTIINPGGKQLQGIRVEICKEKNEPCNQLASFYTGYLATCKQKFLERQMVSVRMENGQAKPVRGYFKVPSCCTCIITQIE